MGVFSLSVLQTWSESAPYVASLQAWDVPLISADELQGYPVRAPKMDLTVKKMPNEEPVKVRRDYFIGVSLLERRDHTHYGVRALVDFGVEWGWRRASTGAGTHAGYRRKRYVFLFRHRASGEGRSRVAVALRARSKCHESSFES